jgi:hypothetical protein
MKLMAGPAQLVQKSTETKEFEDDDGSTTTISHDDWAGHEIGYDYQSGSQNFYKVHLSGSLETLSKGRKCTWTVNLNQLNKIELTFWEGGEDRIPTDSSPDWYRNTANNYVDYSGLDIRGKGGASIRLKLTHQDGRTEQMQTGGGIGWPAGINQSYSGTYYIGASRLAAGHNNFADAYSNGDSIGLYGGRVDDYEEVVHPSFDFVETSISKTKYTGAPKARLFLNS